MATLHHNLINNIIKVLLSFDVYCQYEKVVFVGDFSAVIGEKFFDDFLFQHQLKSISDKITRNKNPDNSSCIDLTPANRVIKLS